jgi:hypothetical protein
MKYDTLSYSLKIWITSVLLTSILFPILLVCKNTLPFSEISKALVDYFRICLFLSFLGIISSSITWLIFWMCISIITNLTSKSKFRTWLIFITGILLALGTLISIFLYFGLFDWISDYYDDFCLISCTWISIGCAAWYYNLNEKDT